MVVEIFVSKRDGIEALRHQLMHAMFDARRVAVIDQTPRYPRGQSGALVDLAEQDATGVGADAPTIEPAGHQTPSQGVKLELLTSTLCLQGCFLAGWRNLLIAQPLCHGKQPFSTPLVRFSG